MSSSADVRDRPSRPPLLHHDPLAGRMAFIAPERAERPNDADLVAVGKPLIANPDLAERFRRGAGLNRWDAKTFYAGGEKGFLDYPTL